MGGCHFIERLLYILPRHRVEHADNPVDAHCPQHLTDALVVVTHIVVGKQRLGGDTPVSLIDGHGGLAEWHTYGSRIVLHRLVGDILQHPVNDTSVSQTHQVAEAATDETLEDEHVTEHCQMRAVGKVVAPYPVTLLDGEEERSAEDGFGYLEHVKGVVLGDALVDAPPYNCPQSGEYRMQRVVRTLRSCCPLVHAQIELRVLVVVFILMDEIMLEGFQIIHGEIVHIQGVVLLLADVALKPLETLNLAHQSPYRSSLPLVEVLVRDIFLHQL